MKNTDHSTIQHILPHPALQPYISCYTFRKIQLAKENCVEKIMPHRLVSSLDFFLGTSHNTIDCKTNAPMPFKRSAIRGPRTYTKYRIQLSGSFMSFTVKFHPTGIYRLFGIPMHYFTNNDIPLTDLGMLPAAELEERLLQQTELAGYVKVIEQYLMVLAKRPNLNSIILNNDLEYKILQRNAMDIKQLANDLCLSLRQTERIFLKGIGLSPKTYLCLSRFDNLIKRRLSDPAKTWTELCYEANFYDQTHMIKTFKSFLNIIPSKFEVSKYAF